MSVLRRPRVVWSGGRARRRTSWAALLTFVSSCPCLLRVSARARAEAGVQGGLGLGLGLGLRLSGPGLGLGLGAGRGAALGAGRGAGPGRGAGRGRGAPLSPLSPLGFFFLPSFFLGLGSFLGFLPSFFFFFSLPTFKLEDESLWRMLPRPS